MIKEIVKRRKRKRIIKRMERGVSSRARLYAILELRQNHSKESNSFSQNAYGTVVSNYLVKEYKEEYIDLLEKYKDTALVGGLYHIMELVYDHEITEGKSTTFLQILPVFLAAASAGFVIGSYLLN